MACNCLEIQKADSLIELTYQNFDDKKWIEIQNKYPQLIKEIKKPEVVVIKKDGTIILI